MDAMLPGRVVINKLRDFIERFTLEGQLNTPTAIIDALHQEIHQIEQTLAKASNQPNYVIQKPRPIEPVTEQQKIIDLAG